MAWNILVYVDEVNNHFKFWSYSSDNYVAWGRIGSNGTSRQFPDDHIRAKVQSKLNEGYRVFAQESNSQSPSNPDIVRRWWENNATEPRPMNQSAPIVSQSVGRTNRRRTPTRVQSSEEVQEEVAEREITQAPTPRTRPIKVSRNHTVPSVGDLKTDNKGYIKKYRTGYTRDVFDSFVSKLRIVNVRQFYQNPTSIDYIKANEYFTRITKTSQYDKPDRIEQLVESQRPTYACVFLKKGNSTECIAIMGVHRGQGFCNFLAIKSSVNFRTNLLKKIIVNISNSVRTDEVTFKLKSSALRREIKEIADFSIEETSTSLKYRKIDLINGIALPKEKPKRWID